MDTAPIAKRYVTPWNKGKLLGQKPPLKLKEIWAIRIRLQLGHRDRDLALLNLAIDSKLRGCDLVRLRVQDVTQGSRVAPRAIVRQKKTQRPVQFEITEQTRDAIAAWIAAAHLNLSSSYFQVRFHVASPIDAAIFAHRRILDCRHWHEPRGLWHPLAATHEGNIDLPADEKSTRSSTPPRPHETRSPADYLGIEVDDALEISEQTEV